MLYFGQLRADNRVRRDLQIEAEWLECSGQSIFRYNLRIRTRMELRCQRSTSHYLLPASIQIYLRNPAVTSRLKNFNKHSVLHHVRSGYGAGLHGLAGHPKHSSRHG